MKKVAGRSKIGVTKCALPRYITLPQKEISRYPRRKYHVTPEGNITLPQKEISRYPEGNITLPQKEISR